eukprot:9038014-Alexandrium_andersonii.AAC.1
MAMTWLPLAPMTRSSSVCLKAAWPGVCGYVPVPWPARWSCRELLGGVPRGHGQVRAVSNVAVDE